MKFRWTGWTMLNSEPANDWDWSSSSSKEIARWESWKFRPKIVSLLQIVVPCASKSFLWGIGILFRNMVFVYRNPDYKVDDHHHPAHWNELKEVWPKKTHLHAGSPSLHGTAGPQVPPAAMTSCALQNWTHLSPVGMAPSLSGTWPGTETLPNQTVKGFLFNRTYTVCSKLFQLVISVLI